MDTDPFLYDDEDETSHPDWESHHNAKMKEKTKETKSYITVRKYVI